MSESKLRQKQAKLLRDFRKIHRLTGAFLFIFFFIVSVTALLLGWKKNSGGLILANSQKGTTTDLRQWLPLADLESKAIGYMRPIIGEGKSLTIDRIDVRPDKGMVKFIFETDFWAVQVDGATGKLLLLERRNADFIEKLHDGSIVDHYLGIKSGSFKLVYTTILSLALLIFTITGFWLWYGPKRMRK